MKEFALIFRLQEMAGFKPPPGQMQDRMSWPAGMTAVFCRHLGFEQI